MTKLYNYPIRAELDKQGLPKRIHVMGRWHRIFSCTAREEERHWWSKLREPEPKRYRVETYQGMVYDLYYAESLKTWVLEKVWD